MNRQIKFRVWDKITNRYLQELGIYYWHIAYSLDGEEITGEANLFGLSELLRHNNFVAQQYTGLTDKNGKEIYEGDIIKEHHFEDWGNDTVGYEYRGVVRYMTRHNYGFNDELKFSGFVTFPNLEENQKYIGNPLKTNCEVIGNIFEHKHLLLK